MSMTTSTWYCDVILIILLSMKNITTVFSNSFLPLDVLQFHRNNAAATGAPQLPKRSEDQPIEYDPA